MLTRDLFETVLIEPIEQGGTTLCIVTGYASPSLVFRHFQEASERFDSEFDLKIIYGMASKDGVPKCYHDQFKAIASKFFPGRFQCLYLCELPPVHSKVYSWLRKETPKQAFVGSANYTQPGFLRHREAVVPERAATAYQYFTSLLPDCIDCLDPNVPNKLHLTELSVKTAERMISRSAEFAEVRSSVDLSGMSQPVSLSLLDRNGNLPLRSGLNWGQRPEYGRNPDQGYIRVPRSVATMGFFPPRSQHFTIITDDNITFDAVVAQDGDKAIETPYDNSLIGRYFRFRLSAKSGAPLTAKHLEVYGRSDVTFVRLDDETYYMDFSVRKSGQSKH